MVKFKIFGTKKFRTLQCTALSVQIGFILVVSIQTNYYPQTQLLLPHYHEFLILYKTELT